jgi:uncharacterized protein DUF6010
MPSSPQVHAAFYVSGGGLGPWELLFPALATPVVYLGLRSDRCIGLFWLMHSAWDLAYHLYGYPIWPFMPSSSFGCLVFDALVALWLLAGAPSRFGFLRRPHEVPGIRAPSGVWPAASNSRRRTDVRRHPCHGSALILRASSDGHRELRAASPALFAGSGKEVIDDDENPEPSLVRPRRHSGVRGRVGLFHDDHA